MWGKKDFFGEEEATTGGVFASLYLEGTGLLIQLKTTRSGGLRKGQSPCEFLGGLSGFLSRRCRGLRPCVESVPEPEVSSPVLTWILGYIWSLPRGVSPRLEWGHARALSSQAVAAVSRFPSRGSRDLWFPSSLSRGAFPQCYSTCHHCVSRSSALKSKQCRENRNLLPHSRGYTVPLGGFLQGTRAGGLPVELRASGST